ncbi:MAG: acyltransferase [Thermogemmatispora sp.]|uniref:acyltransferase family protein n=3 Tax=Thermogemmatispora sp. TaxID=1968838 RepID=UPI001D6B3A50|nr:acyltransferase [Thermogemmatispora sp.]MBX5450976.1 acyltransferase [Thermogemmatispora sp.]
MSTISLLLEVMRQFSPWRWLRAGGSWLRRLPYALPTLMENDLRGNAIPMLDGVRALACLAVLVFHVNWTTYHQHLWQPLHQPLVSSFLLVGSTGVTLFFILSGFLLFLPYVGALLSEERPWPSVRRFYLRRALRIWPAYYVSLFILITLWQPQYWQPAHWRELLLFVTFFMDSTPETFRKINGPYWTLAIEWQFYLLLPLLSLGIFLLLRRLPQRRRFPLICAVLVLVIAYALLVRHWGDYYVDHPVASLPLVPRAVLNVMLFFVYGMAGKFLEDFAIGMLIATCYTYGCLVKPTSGLIGGLRRGSLALWTLGLALFGAMALWHLNHDVGAFPWLGGLLPLYDTLSEFGFALAYGSCLTGLLFGPSLLRSFFSWRYLRWIGLVSYSLYIWHLPLIAYFSTHIQPWLSGLNHWLIYGCYWLWVGVTVLPLAFLSYLLVERPFLKLGQRLLQGGGRGGAPSLPERQREPLASRAP